MIHPAIVDDLVHLAEGWLAVSVIAAIVWGAGLVHTDIRDDIPAGRWVRRTPEPTDVTVVARPVLFDQDVTA